MSTFSKATFSIAFFFACIGFAVCLFFLPTKYAIIMGLFTGALYYLVFSIWDRIYSKKAMKALDDAVEEPLYKYIVNCCDDKPIRNGWLFLTKTELVFMNMEKKKIAPVRIPIADITSVEYGAVLKYIQGMFVEKKDGEKIGFTLPPQEFENVKKVISEIKYGN